MKSIALLLACVAAATCNDIQSGANYGRVIFNQNVQASPAIWRQSQRITINATNTEVISGVIITDQRPDKDGDAKILEGGEGQKNVTIELQSPSVFRGFDFKVVVYAVQEDVRPALLVPITNDTNINNSGIPQDEESVDSITTDKISTTVPSDEVENTDKPNAPVIVGDQIRNYRNTQRETDPIVPYVNKMTIEGQTTEHTEATELTTSNLKNVPESTTFSVQTEATDSAPTVNGPSSHPGLFITEKAFDDKKTSHSKEQLQVPKLFSTELTHDSVKIEDLSRSSTTAIADVTTEGNYVSTSTNTPIIRAPAAHKDFESISKELGQTVVFGIRKH